MSTLAIDYDDTIHNPKDRLKGYKLGQPMPGAVDALNELKAQGHRIIVHCVWADTVAGVNEIKKWMQYFKLPYDGVTATKPAADWYIDDKALHFDNWKQVMEDLK